MTHPRVAPPSTRRFTPVMKDAASDARNTIGAATSSGCPTLFIACHAAIPARRSALGVPFCSDIVSNTSVSIVAAVSMEEVKFEFEFKF